MRRNLIHILLGLGVLLAGFQAMAYQTTSSLNVTVPSAVVSGLPTCNAAARGTIYMVTDALAPVALATVAGSGAVVVLVACNGAAWIVG